MNDQQGIPTQPTVPGQPYVPAQTEVPVQPPVQPISPPPVAPVAAQAPVQAKAHYEPCEACGAPMDQQQRYCVECATRRGNGTNPSSRYFAAMNKRARRPLAKPGSKPPGGSRAAAVGFFALLPIAVAIGVVVGNAGGSSSGGSDEQALLQALREQSSGGGATTTAANTTAGKSKDKAKSTKQPAKGDGKVVAKTSNGTVHQVAGFVPSKQKEEEDGALVESNPEQVGSNYIKAQQNLPDVVVVPGNPDEAPAMPTGQGQP